MSLNKEMFQFIGRGRKRRGTEGETSPREDCEISVANIGLLPNVIVKIKVSVEKPSDPFWQLEF